MNRDPGELENIISYIFRDKELLKKALTHPSYSAEAGLPRYESNQRLEFLGDAVLELLISDYLYHEDEKAEEGELTRERSSLVFESALADCARRIELGDFLLLGVGETACRGFEKPSILADAFEALTGAVYLDGGFRAARRFAESFVVVPGADAERFLDGKSLIQKYVQKTHNMSLRYDTTHSDTQGEGFVSKLYIGGWLISEGQGHSKKQAEQDAAAAACDILGIS